MVLDHDDCIVKIDIATRALPLALPLRLHVNDCPIRRNYPEANS